MSVVEHTDPENMQFYFKVSVSHRVLLKTSHMECDAVSLIEWYPSFPNIVVPSSSKVTRLAS